MWEGAPGAVVSAAAAGKVRAVGEDEILGRYVRLTHSGDLETIYYGLSDIQVEAGQPLRVYDTLGTLGESGALRLMVLLEGKPQDPGKYMSLVDAG
jgi:murein DD-endopeptidase MepM/ murein hydrolase activator NlpD